MTEESMSDDLFWPPISGGEDDKTAEYTVPTASPPAAGPAAERREGRRWTALALVGVTAFVFGGGGVAIGAELVNNDSSAPTPGAGLNVATATPSSLEAKPNTYAAIAAKVLPSVVSITVVGSGQSDTGSGIILRPDGYILTNNHVVAAAANGGKVSATFNNGSTSSAKIVGTDSLDDLAVIKVSRTGLQAATLGDSSQLQVGDPVLAVGSPLRLNGTVTAGIVSALNRPVVTQESQPQPQVNPFGFDFGNSQPNSSTQQTVIDAIQTDAAINPGNSGGALVNAVGQVIGVNSAIASLGSDLLGSQSGNIGVGFAIPINEAKTIATELINTGHAVHPLLGVTLAGDTSDGSSPKATVEAVTAGGPADKAGIKKGDVITSVNGIQTQGSDAVIAAIRSLRPGQQVVIGLQRGGTPHRVTATLTTQSSTQG
jgi:putative serine protease PepD